MGALYEVLSPSAQRGSRLDLGLQRMRHTAGVGRVHLVLTLAGESQPTVLKECVAPPDPALDAELAALGEALARVTDRAFVRVRHLARAVEGATIGVLSEYVEGRPGVAPQDPALRARAVRVTGLALIDALERLSREHGIVHGDVKPANVLLGGYAPGAESTPVRVFDLGAGAVATLVLASLRRSHPALAERIGTSREVPSPLGHNLFCTTENWGTPGYVPLGHFEPGRRPSLGSDLYASLATLWHLLTGAPLVPDTTQLRDAATGSRHRAVTEYEDSLRALIERNDRREHLRERITRALPDANAGALDEWVAVFDRWIPAGANDPASLDADALRESFANLPDPHATSQTIPATASAPPAEVPSFAAPVLEAGKEYRAEVILDYFSGDPGDTAGSRSLRFRHVSMLGEGAMGSVHKVEVLRPGDAPLPAALKLAVDDSVQNRDAILREAHVLRARLLDGVAQFMALVSLGGGATALLMSYQPGIPLEALIESRRLRAEEALALGRRLFGTLVALHADATADDPAEVVHGDIKPGNVIIPLDAHNQPEFGAAVLIDFGVSRLRLRLAGPPTTTTEGSAQEVLGGTVGYMPIGHLQKGATPASDVFAVAVILFESLTGAQPWKVANPGQYSAFGYAYAMQEAMRKERPARVTLRQVPPWDHPRGWNRFFVRVLAHGDTARIPPAREALAALNAVRRDLAWPLLVLALTALTAAAALGAWYYSVRVYCKPGQVRCDGTCTDLLTSDRHCGACSLHRDHACNEGYKCGGGVCRLSCPEGQVSLGNRCIDPNTDREHCGPQHVACAQGEVCSSGSCLTSCGEGLTDCAGSCRDLRTDRAHCGGCSNPECRAGEVCDNGHCRASCGQGLTLCLRVCRDFRTDRAHCGACGRACAPGEVCQGGQCVTSCAAGLIKCGDACRDPRVDRAHCGACGNVCQPGESCVAGRCVQECSPGQSLCDGRCRDPRADSDHCGVCGRECAPGERCVNAACAVTCAQGFAPCGGACFDLANNRAHCGACGSACSRGEVCAEGRCVVSCAAGLTDCAGVCRDTRTDEGHCGACGSACSRGEVCAEGRCALVCTEGLTACGGACRDLDADESNCGACGRACDAHEACVRSSCRPLARSPAAVLGSRHDHDAAAEPAPTPTLEPSPAANDP